MRSGWCVRVLLYACCMCTLLRVVEFIILDLVARSGLILCHRVNLDLVEMLLYADALLV